MNYGSPNPSIFALSLRNSFYLCSSYFPNSPWEPLFPPSGSESPMIPMPRAPVIQISWRALLIPSLPKSCGGVPFLVLRERDRERERETRLEGTGVWKEGRPRHTYTNPWNKRNKCQIVRTHTHAHMADLRVINYLSSNAAEKRPLPPPDLTLSLPLSPDEPPDPSEAGRQREQRG